MIQKPLPIGIDDFEKLITGLNNLAVYSVLSKSYDEYFGFTQREVDAVLEARE